jgi:anti-sigma factor RsiW
MEDLKVTRDVIMDLLPVYESGEASEDTRQIVERYLAQDPEFARLVARLKQIRLNSESAAPPPDVHMKSLKRTKNLMRQQTSIMAVAIFFSLAPFAFWYDGDRVTFLLIRDGPIVGGTYLACAAVLWTVYFFIRRKLKVH